MRLKLGQCGTRSINKAIRTFKSYFSCYTPDPIPISFDLDNPTVITTGLVEMSSNGFEVGTDYVKNIGRHTIKSITGTISAQPSFTGSPGQWELWSEKSPDGITWTALERSLRNIEIRSTSESFETSVSFTVDWKTGEYIRFVSVATTDGLVLGAPSIVTNGVTVLGNAVTWELTEQ